MSEYVVIVTTVNTEELAKTIAQELVRSQLAACVNIIPDISSIYTWKNEIATDKELVLLIKSRAKHVDAIGEKIKALHSYELPEVIVLPIIAGDSAYLKWIDDVTK